MKPFYLVAIFACGVAPWIGSAPEKKYDVEIAPIPPIPPLGRTLSEPFEIDRAPFGQPAAAAGAPGHVKREVLSLTSTAVSNVSQAAVINGKTVKVGDRIGELTVSRIEKGVVDLSGKGSVRHLTIQKDQS